MSFGLFKKGGKLSGSASAAPAKAKPAAPARPVMSYHAVTIDMRSKACAAAQGLKGKKFLSREAPRLPLKECDCATCECKYVHHDDRREGPRRAREMGVAIDGYQGRDNRKSSWRGRRVRENS